MVSPKQATIGAPTSKKFARSFMVGASSPASRSPGSGRLRPYRGQEGREGRRIVGLSAYTRSPAKQKSASISVVYSPSERASTYNTAGSHSRESAAKPSQHSVSQTGARDAERQRKRWSRHANTVVAPSIRKCVGIGIIPSPAALEAKSSRLYVPIATL